MKKLYAFLAMFLIVYSLSAQVNGDYRTTQVGPWNSTGWEKYVGGAWSNGGGFYSAPNPVPSGVTVYIYHLTALVGSSSGAANAYHLVNNGTIEVASGASFYVGLNIGTPWAPDYRYGNLTGSGDVNFVGLFGIAYGSATIGSGGTISEQGGSISGATYLTVDGTYDYSLNAGSLPSGITWGSSSVLELSAITNSFPVFQTDSYNDLTISSPGLSSNVEIENSVASKFTNIIIENTGSYAIETDAGDLTTVSGNLTIGASAKLIIQPTSLLTVSGTLTNSAGIAGFVINSNATKTGSLLTSSTVSGTFNQFISNGQWHLIGSPVTQGSGATLADFNPASGDGYMRSYETVNSGWGAYMTDVSTQLVVGTGYEYWTTVDNTVSVTGTFNNGAQNNTLLSTGNQYNLIANPYPCSIDWTTVSDRSNVHGSTMYMYSNTSGTEGYFAVNGSGVSTPSGANQYIPPFQGIFVEQSSGSTLNFSSTNKAHGDKAFYKESKEPSYFDLVRLHVAQEIDEETMYSEVVVLQDLDATNEYDILFDTKRLGNGGSDLVAPSVYAMVDSEKIIINSISTYPAVVPVEIEVVDAGIVTLTVSELSNIQPYTEIRLEDIETGEFYDLDENFAGLTLNAEPGIIDDRFLVHYNTSVGLEEESIENTSIYSNRNIIYIDYNSSEDVDVQIVNMMGQTIYEGKKSGNGLTTITLDQPSAYYIVHLISEQNTMTKKLYIAK